MTNKWIEIIKTYLVENRNVSELATVGNFNLYIRENGIRKEIPSVFKSKEEYIESCLSLAKVIAPNDNRLEFLMEGQLDLGHYGTARVHIVLPPTCEFPLVTIAKKTTSLTTLDDIFKKGSMSQRMLNFIKAAIDCRFTIVLSGGTGAGKTTMLEAMTKLFPEDLRIGVVEDSPELKLVQRNVCYLKSTPVKPGMDKNDLVTLDWCVRQINRMRTDLLIIGETRGKEFKDFISAANSGMEGSMTTLHANNPRMALQKMGQFIMEAQAQPIQVVNKSIASTIQLIIQLNKTDDGKYLVTSIEAVSQTVGNDENATISTTTLSEYNTHTERWTDTFIISDKMRKALESKGYDCQNFAKRGANDRWTMR